MELESLTNDRIRDETGEIHLVAPEDSVSGPGASVIMAPFTHRNPEGSRFSGGSYGVFYAGRTLETAIKETCHHAEIFMRRTREEPVELDRRVYETDLNGDLHDIRGMKNLLPEVHSPDSYSASRELGRSLRDQNAWGIAYESVRHPGGDCAGIFRPPVLSNCRQTQHLCYAWDGERITHVYEKRLLGN